MSRPVNMDFNTVCPHCGAEKSFVYCCGFKGHWQDDGSFHYSVPVPGKLQWLPINPNSFNWKMTTAPAGTLPVITEVNFDEKTEKLAR